MARKPNSATGKTTAQVPKKDSSQHKIESAHTEGRGPIKQGRNMGGRDALGARVRGAQGPAGQ